MMALARGLTARGHETTFVGQADLRQTMEARALRLRVVGTAGHPPGTLDRMQARLSRTTGVFGIGGVIRDIAKTTDMLCRDGPAALREIGAEAIVADQTEPAGGLLARHLGLPQVSVANALLIDREPAVPPPFIGWPYDPSEWGIKRNRGGYRVADFLMRPVRAGIRHIAADWTLGPLDALEDCLSPTLEISQTIASLDFPRAAPPPHLFHVGPLRDAEPQRFDPPDARPLVFCSLGTLQGSRLAIFKAVARACAAQNLSLVIAHGGKLDARQIASLPGNPTVAAYVPQRAVMARASVVVTHGGLNTVLDALAAGIPLIVIPIAFEQGAIAARVERSGAGLSISLRRLTPDRLAAALDRVMTIPDFCARAQALRAEAELAGGVSRAVSLIEAAVRYSASS